MKINHAQFSAALLATSAIAAARPAGVISVRAEGADPKALVEGINKAVVEMRARLDARDAADPLAQATIDKINAGITDLTAKMGEQTKTLDEQAATISALRVGGGGDPDKAQAREESKIFAASMRGTPEARGSTFSDPDGGFLTPPSIDGNVSRILGRTVVMRRLAQVLTVPKGFSSHKKFKSLGGSTSGWAAENDSRPETNTPQLAELNFPLHELYASPMTSQRLIDDGAFDVESWYSAELATEFAEKEGAAFITGDGVKKPRGLLSYTNVDNANYAWGSIGYKKSGHASTLLPDGILDLIYALKGGYRVNAKFIANDLTIAAVRKLKDTTGQYLWQPMVAAGEPATLLGYGIESADNMPDVGAGTYPLAFGDFNQAYMVVDRAGVAIIRDNVTSKPNVMFYSTKRVGGGVQNFEAVKLQFIGA